MANSIDTILYIGKAGVLETTAAQFEAALLARELIKAKCLEASPVTPREAAQQLAERLQADIVQVIGSKFVLYKKHPEKPQITLL